MSSSCFYDLSEDDLAESADDDMEVINEDNVVDEDSHDASEELLSSTLKEMSQAFNTLNILGLALRNYSAEIDLDTRESMVCSGYSLSLRSLSAFSSLIHDGKKELAIIARRHLRVNQLASRSNLASRLMTTCSFGVIRRTTQAFASPHLELLLRDIWQKDSRTAVLLLRFSIMLDLRKAGAKEAEKLFQKLNSNPCARAVLGYVVANHLRSFRASEERRLALCNAVKIDPNNPMLIYTKEKPRFVGDKRYAHTDTSIGKRKRN